MAIERIIFKKSTWAEHYLEILDWIGTPPTGLTIDSTGIKATVGENTVTLAGTTNVYKFGFSTSQGIMLVNKNRLQTLVITYSDGNSAAVVGGYANSAENLAYHALDLGNSTEDFTYAKSLTAADITSFVPVVLGTETYTPHLFACHAAQWRAVGTINAGGKQYAYDGFLALEE